MSKPDVSIIVCVNERFTPGKHCCAPAGVAIADSLEALVRSRGLNVEVERIHCFGYCEHGPNVRIAPGGDFFHNVDPDALDEIVERVAALA